MNFLALTHRLATLSYVNYYESVCIIEEKEEKSLNNSEIPSIRGIYAI